MILSNIKNFETYYNFDKRILKALEYMQKLDSTVSNGEIEIESSNIYLKIMTVYTGNNETKKFERHSTYTDIHLVLEGRQIIEFAHLNNFTEDCIINAEDDIGFYNENINGSKILLNPEMFTIFFPADCHKPLCMIDKPEKIKVCVAKVKL